MNKTTIKERNLMPFDNAISCLPQNIKCILQNLPLEVKNKLQEIRLRSNRPIILYSSESSYFVTKQSKITRILNEDVLYLKRNEVFQSFHNICNYSIYSYQNEIKNGFITMNGGHRVGICGTAVMNNSDDIMTIKDISSLNIRIAREVKGVADELIRKLGNNISGLLIVGAPSCGKTTMLRDLARQMSLNMVKVCVIDERGELGAVCKGVCQNDLGFCDVLTGYPKGKAILQAVRCLSPDIIICDELGSDEEIEAITLGLNAGVGVIASVHASSMEELRRKVQIKKLISTGAFQRVALMGSRSEPGLLRGIYRIGDVNA